MVKGELKFSVRFLTFDDDTSRVEVMYYSLCIGHQQKPKKDRRHKFFSVLSFGSSSKSFHILEYAFIWLFSPFFASIGELVLPFGPNFLILELHSFTRFFFWLCSRMFPTIRCSFSGFQDFLFGQKFAILLDVVPCDSKRYRYAYHRSSWLVAGKADPPPPRRQYLHPDSPFTNRYVQCTNFWIHFFVYLIPIQMIYFIPCRQLDQQRLVVSFEKVKLTNNESDQTGQIILNSMHKFQPRIHLVIVSDQWNASHGIDLQRMKHKTFVFDLTAFTAVTAYQNQLVSS